MDGKQYRKVEKESRTRDISTTSWFKSALQYIFNRVTYLKMPP